MTYPNHPLNNDECRTVAAGMIGFGHRFPNAHDHMRAGADWQLEQAYNRLEDFVEEFSYRGHHDAANYELRCFLSSFKSYMRPTQEDNS